MSDCDSLKKALILFSKANELCVLFGLILMTPAKEIKRKKLRQIKKELLELALNVNKEE